MKINTIIHDKPKERKNDLHKNNYNKNPKYHPFMKEREFMRAVNATKVDRLLAKPFVKAYNFHLEGITHLSHEKENDFFASSSFDQSTYVWNVKEDTKYKIKNDYRITGLTFCQGNLLIGQNDSVISYTGEWNEQSLEINNTYKTNYINSLTSSKNMFIAGTNEGIKIYDLERNLPKFTIGNSVCNFAEINPVLENLVVFSENDRLNFVDTRINEIYSNFSLGIRNNDIKFNLDGKLMAVGNEDSILYVYDLRNLDHTLCFFKHHFSAINCIDFGKKLVSGSADKTVRIFDVKERRCLDVYHNKRMHNVNGIKLSNTEEFVISGSDDGSLRIWKTYASKKIGPVSINQSRAMAYNETLKDKFKYVNEVKRIANQRFLPKPLKRELKVRKEQEEAQKRREAKKKQNQK